MRTTEFKIEIRDSRLAPDGNEVGISISQTTDGERKRSAWFMSLGDAEKLLDQLKYALAERMLAITKERAQQLLDVMSKVGSGSV